MENVVKEGLSEKSKLDSALGTDHKRHGANQVPKKGTEKASKGGKSFKIK